MSTNAPQTLSVKRKRNEAPVDSLIVERHDKRLKAVAYPPSNMDSTIQNFPLKRKVNPNTEFDDSSSQRTDSSDKRLKANPRTGTIVWRRIKIPHASDHHNLVDTPPETPTRRFHVSHTDGERILIEHRQDNDKDQNKASSQGKVIPVRTKPQPTPIPLLPSAPRKRPGAGSALHPRDPKLPHKPTITPLGPSEETIRAFEQFSAQVENEESAPPTPRSRMKFQPKVPKLRYKDRHPEKTAKSTPDPNAMDIDTAEYVYDTYEIVMPDANGNTPEPEGTVGFIVLEDEDKEWWFGDESEDESVPDDEDENAEDYYTNDYPEDELSSDDEFDRNPYKYYHGSDEEDYDMAEDREDEEDDNIVPSAPRVAGQRKVQGYW